MEYTLENLDVFITAENLSNKIWDLIIDKDWFVKSTVGKQLVNSSDSISANIAEGYGRYSFKDDSRFLIISRGSLLETKSWIRKCKARKIFSEADADSLLEELETIKKKLNGYINFVEKGIPKSKPKE